MALLGTGAIMTDGDVFLPMPAKAVKARNQCFELTRVRYVAYAQEVVASLGPGRVREDIVG